MSRGKRNSWITDCVGGKRPKAPAPRPRQAEGLNAAWSDGSLGVYHPSKHAHARAAPRPKRRKAKG